MLSRILAGSLVIGTALVVSVGAWGQEGATSSGAVEAKEATAAGVQPGTAMAEPGGSQVRIVRLSQVRGGVRMDRNTGRGFEGAFTNIPVVQGAKLLTGDGVAEVEFEDNSTVRLAPESEVEFARLGRSATGETVTTVKLGKGLIYVSMQKGKAAGEFTVQYGPAQVVMGQGAHLRVDATQASVELAMFDGSAQVELGSATTALSKKQTLTLNPATQTMAPVQKGTQEVAWDEWDSTQTGYHKNVSSFAGAGSGFGLYGTNDLAYYGSFVDMPGCGSMWRPYFANAAWDPFGNGIWTYYQGAGYSWVSPYPWGWLPYHSGSWASCGNAGWGWRPGGTWMGLTNHWLTRVGKNPIVRPIAPTGTKGAPTLVPVNTRPLAISGVTGNGKFTFQQNSAGLGVPRESFREAEWVFGSCARRSGDYLGDGSGVLPGSFGGGGEWTLVGRGHSAGDRVGAERWTEQCGVQFAEQHGQWRRLSLRGGVECSVRWWREWGRAPLGPLVPANWER